MNAKKVMDDSQPREGAIARSAMAAAMWRILPLILLAYVMV